MNDNIRQISKFINLENLNTNKAFDIICVITPAIGKIIKDKNIQKIFNDRLIREEHSELTDEEFNRLTTNKGIEMITDIIPLILKNYREDIFLILSALSDKTIDEIRNQNVLETIEQINLLLNHEGIMGFLQ